jgi:predicted enzyme related to lactoylglutathione lyase
MAQVIGLGGVFLKFQNPEAMRIWYKDVLGMAPNAYRVLFEFNGDTHPTKGYQLGTFEASSDYFGDPNQQAMLNFRVDDLETFKTQLEAANVTIVDAIESYSYGKYLHIEDPEGNRIELWETVDSEFEKVGDAMPMK